MDEQILVVPTAEFHKIGHFQGFCSDPKPYLYGLINPDVMQFRPRAAMEEDPSFKQLIPYIVIYNPKKREVFSYVRDTKIREGRLAGLRSIGVGGHIKKEDGDVDPYTAGLHRELGEEVAISPVYEMSCIGIINDDSTPVGKVHLGIVHQLSTTGKVGTLEDDLQDGRFIGLDELRKMDKTQFGAWSAIAMDHIRE